MNTEESNLNILRHKRFNIQSLVHEQKDKLVYYKQPFAVNKNIHSYEYSLPLRAL